MTGIEVGVAVIIGVLLGRFLPNRRKGPKVKAVKPVCGCGHHHGFHDPATGECHGTVRGEATEFDDYASRNPVAWAQVQCSCRQYSGPVPMPEYYAPELSTGEPS